MKTPTNFTLRRSSVDDAPLLYSVIDRTMREFVLKTWGRRIDRGDLTLVGILIKSCSDIDKK
jgi:hypothetical protein